MEIYDVEILPDPPKLGTSVWVHFDYSGEGETKLLCGMLGLISVSGWKSTEPDVTHDCLLAAGVATFPGAGHPKSDLLGFLVPVKYVTRIGLGNDIVHQPDTPTYSRIVIEPSGPSPAGAMTTESIRARLKEFSSPARDAT